MKRNEDSEQFERRIGIKIHPEGRNSFTGFVVNFRTTMYKDKGSNEEASAVQCYIEDEDGNVWRVLMPYLPYFYVECFKGTERETLAYIEAKVAKVEKVEFISKTDLEQENHLTGIKKDYLKVSFKTTRDLNNARGPLRKIADDRKKRIKQMENVTWVRHRREEVLSIEDSIVDIKEFDIPFHTRVCIDTGLRAGKWFNFETHDQIILNFSPNETRQSVPDLRILAYDIETSKEPLKFPDATRDEVIMISLMYQGEAFLIVNSSFCGQTVHDFQYRPNKPEFICPVNVFNELNEHATIMRFAQLIQSYRPAIITSFNGDRFDYPFIMNRCTQLNINFALQMGLSEQSPNQFFGSYVSHLDCFYWVDRDAFLPQGSHGLKAVTKAKLNYDPVEVDPENMVPMARNDTQRLANYSVSDAVATYHLYMKHIHGFIFALATIIPMKPDEVLRKGSGTLCENLLMAEAYNRGLIFPNKKIENFEQFYRGQLLDTETYTGGKVECLRTGVYRADIPTEFTLEPAAFDQLIKGIDETVRFAIKYEMPEESFDQVNNLQSVREELTKALSALRDVKYPSRHESLPLIYHLDVAAMYPNIILTNRLQPTAVVNDRICSGCQFNDPVNNCKRELQWEWRGEVFPLKEGEYLRLKETIVSQGIEAQEGSLEYEKKFKAEVKNYCQKVYKKIHTAISEVRNATVCMRQNSFYVDTVRAFRDRRYIFKHKVKEEKKKLQACQASRDIQGAKQADKMMELYESMQLAHKIILNSFYGYVMRKGARWYSMETAAMVTFIGSAIISDSKNFVEGRIGKPLELDTDGIWMLLPHGFPDTIQIKFKSGKSFKLSYPCHILNQIVAEKYSNPQYQNLVDPENFLYEHRQEMSILFEIDGPYKAMMIPAAKERQKSTGLDTQQQYTQLLKKRYVVFNFKNEIKQFKGFEMKRRGELRITKVFQEEIFPQYTKGTDLKSMYHACAEVARKYLSIIQKRGLEMDVDSILDYLHESRVLSKDLKEYGETKGVAISSARRLAQFLGPQVIKGTGGLCCYFVISAYPPNRPVTQRALPIQIFEADLETQRKFISKWTKNDKFSQMASIDIRQILDWDYYFERLSAQIQKMICIPAVLQGVSNPVPQIALPPWLEKKTYDMRHHKQTSIISFLQNKPSEDNHQAKDTSNQGASAIKTLTTTPIKLAPENPAPQLTPGSRFVRSKLNPHSLKHNFPEWLVEQQRIWKEHKNNPVKRTLGHTEAVSKLKHILMISKCRQPGLFTVWFMVGGNKIQQVLLNIRRRYYEQDPRGNKKAPHEQGSASQIIIEEPKFQQTLQYYSDIIGKTFYETKIPLLVNLMIRKGNVWRMPVKATINDDEVFEEFSEPYLPRVENSFPPYVVLARLKVLTHRTVWMLYNPIDKSYLLYFLDKAKNADEKELLFYARKEAGPEATKIKIDHKKSNDDIVQSLTKAFQNIQKELKQPVLVMLSGISLKEVKQLGLTRVSDQLPTLFLWQLEAGKVDSLSWKRQCIKVILGQPALVSDRVSKLLNWSRYGQVPLCNLSHEPEMLDFITNISYSRVLLSANQLSWWDEYNSEITPSYQPISMRGRILNPGLFSTYAIQVLITDLTINALANADELAIQDRQTAFLMQKKSRSNEESVQFLDQITKVKRAFELLKKLVMGWIRDYKSSQGDESFQLLKNVQKWVITRNNALFDPLLMRIVNKFATKIFELLVHRLSELGMDIVYGNFSKLIVVTEKHRFNEANNSISYILKKCVQDNTKIFGYLTLTPLNLLYRVLLFKDQRNFIGLNDNGEAYFKFDSAYKLHPEVGQRIQIVLIHFLKQIWTIKKELQDQYSTNAMQLTLHYRSLINERIKAYINGQFTKTFAEHLVWLYKRWQNYKIRATTLGQTETDFELEDEDNEGQNEEEENDSFVVDDDEVELEEEGRPNRKGKKNKYNKTPENQMQSENAVRELAPIIADWGEKNQLDIMIETVFSLLSFQKQYLTQLQIMRKEMLKLINLQPTLTYPTLQPVYPIFELPCSNCLSVNEFPGLCEFCEAPIKVQKELQTSVWKMLQEQQSRDLYCVRCKRAKPDYLRKCDCGQAKMFFKQAPIEWVKHTKRDTEDWSFVNKVFEFMGIN